METKDYAYILVLIVAVLVAAIGYMALQEDDDEGGTASEDDSDARFNYKIVYSDSFRADNGRTYTPTSGMKWAVVSIRMIDDGPYDVRLGAGSWSWSVVAGGRVCGTDSATTNLRGYSDAIIAPGGTGTTARAIEVPSASVVDELRISYTGSATLALDRSIVVSAPDLGASPDVYYRPYHVGHMTLGGVEYVMVGMTFKNNTSHSIDMALIKADVDGMADNFKHYSSTYSHMIAPGETARAVLYGCYNQGDVEVTTDTNFKLTYTTLSIYGTTFARDDNLTV